MALMLIERRSTLLARNSKILLVVSATGCKSETGGLSEALCEAQFWIEEWE